MSEPFPTSHFRLGSFAQRHYKRAPIIEAMITFNLEMPSGFEAEALRNFAQESNLSYGAAGEERAMGFTASPAGVNTQESTLFGFRFVSQDGKYALACRINAFSLSRLAPYETWEAFRDETRGLWKVFREKYNPVKVNGLSVRYINRIEIPWKPGQQIDFRWYFRTFPEVSSDLDVGMESFYMRVDIPLYSIGARLILNQARLPAASPQPESLSVLLDSDLIFSCEDGTEDYIWDHCEILRKAKNDVFEACITNLTRELFQ